MTLHRRFPSAKSLELQRLGPPTVQERFFVLFSLPIPCGMKAESLPRPLCIPNIWFFSPFLFGERRRERGGVFLEGLGMFLLCVWCVWRWGFGPLPLRCKGGYLSDSMGFSLITYLITEEFEQCVCFGKEGGGLGML